ncbi:MAG TPA: HD domain-containing protein [Terriglobales bacterium]|nr:HD domain-containing protein [Terriglobales bacterium]
MSSITTFTENPRLTQRFNDALVFTAELHCRQTRKGGDQIPYISHLLGVASLVIEAGGDEDMAIAALLHDAVEDQGGMETLERIRERFGERVAHVVVGCTDDFTGHNRTAWCDRKTKYIEHLREESDEETRIVSLADKVHNARTILLDYIEQGDAVFARFRARKDGTIWYYRSLVDAFRYAEEKRPIQHHARGHERLLRELDRLIGKLEQRTNIDGRSVNPCRG